MRRTKIVATIGPASRDPEVLVRMVEAGMDVARLNFSHGIAEEHAETAPLVRQAAGRAGRQVAVLQDLPGPKLRIGPLTDGIAELKPGDDVTFVLRRQRRGRRRPAHVRSRGPACRHRRGGRDHLPRRRRRPPAREGHARPATARSTPRSRSAARVASRQGLNVPGEPAALPSVPEEDLEHAAHRRADRRRHGRAVVRAPRRGRDALRKHTRLPLIAKIEKPQAVERAEEIVHAADCVMVARGDLGIELRIEEVPIVQKQVIALAGALARPSITATQMLDSMVASSRPDPRRGRPTSPTRSSTAPTR